MSNMDGTTNLDMERNWYHTLFNGLHVTPAEHPEYSRFYVAPQEPPITLAPDYCNPEYNDFRVAPDEPTALPTQDPVNPEANRENRTQMSGHCLLSQNQLRFHQKEKLYPCVICNTSFSTDSGRILHTWSHREHTYQSVNDNQNLPQSEGLVSHQIEHTGKTSFDAEKDNWFITGLNQPEENFPPEENFRRCMTCKQRFAQSESDVHVLTNVTNEYHGESSYECGACEAKKQWCITGL